MPPATSPPPAAGSVPIWPLRKSRSPTLTAGENGRVGAPYGVRNSGAGERPLAHAPASNAQITAPITRMVVPRSRVGFPLRAWGSGLGARVAVREGPAGGHPPT